ncbi:MAG: T9SS type A sorting domain-containing protein [Acidobacteriota bacterium]
MLSLLFIITLFSPSIAQHPALYFSAADTAALRDRWKNGADAFPLNGFKEQLSRGRWSFALVRPSQPDGWADYDRAKAQKAKAYAFRFLMEESPADGDSSFVYLLTKYAADGYVYQGDNYARWMTNGLALIDYCAAFDFLAGAGYFDPNRHPGSGKDAAWWDAQRAAIVRNLHDKASALYNRVRTIRTGSDAFTAQLLGNQTVLNEVKFHAQVGNHRIIVASALGVAAYALRNDYPAAETDPWLDIARRDVEQFLLNRERYAPASDKKISVASQNAGGAFPEGMEYLNYSGEGFVPFMLASIANGGEDYTKDAGLKNLMDRVYAIQAPDGSSPQINSTGYGIFPINSLFSELIPSSRHYLSQLAAYSAVYGFWGTSPAEAFIMLQNAHSASEKPFAPITVAPGGGEIVMRNSPLHPTRYVLIAAKSGAARSAAELHGYADAGSFIYATDKGVLVRHPGYAGYSASRDLETAAAHNTVLPVVNGAILSDAPDRSQALPPTADASIVQTKFNTNFALAGIRMDLNGPRPVSNGDIFSMNSDILSLRYEYISSNWMSSRLNMTKYGSCTRKFLMINNTYLVVVDDAVASGSAMQYAVSSIHGNNGNNQMKDAALAGTRREDDGEVRWTAASGQEALRVNTAALGGKAELFSGLDAGIHQSPDASQPDNARALYYHAVLKTAAPFIAGHATMLSVLEIDPSSNDRTGITTRRTAAADTAMAVYTVDGRGKPYGRYDLIMMRNGTGAVQLADVGLPGPVSTDASFLVMSLPGTPDGAKDIRIFADNARFVTYGGSTFVPADSGEAQMTFAIHTMATAVPPELQPQSFALAQNYPNPFNPSTTIHFALPQACTVSLRVYDVLGREVAALADGFMAAGAHEAVWDASRFTAGMYICRLSAGSFSAQKTMLLVK